MPEDSPETAPGASRAPAIIQGVTLALLGVFVAAAALAGFLVNATAGFGALAGASLIVALLLGWEGE